VLSKRNWRISKVRYRRISQATVRITRGGINVIKSILIPFVEILQLQSLSSEVAINELPLHCEQGFSLASESGLETVECLYACLRAVKAWFDIFLKYEPSAYVGFSMSIWKQLTGKLLALYRLSALDDPAWDTGLVRRSANLSLILDQITSNLQQVALSCGWKNDRAGQENVFSRSIKVIGIVRTWLDSAVRPSSVTVPDDQMQVIEDHQQQAAPFPLSAGFPPMDQTELWTREFLGLWDMYAGRTFAYME
jgi:hypothetical protein